MSEFEYKKKYIKYKKKYLNLKNHGGASNESDYPFINLVDNFDLSREIEDLNFILDKKYWNLIDDRVSKELGIEPNRFSYDHKNHQIYSYLFVSQNYPLSENNYNKLVTIINDKYKKFYNRCCEIHTDKKDIEDLLNSYKKNELINIINDCYINKTKKLIPLGQIQFTIKEDGIDSMKIHISRVDAWTMIRGGGNLMLCFLINIFSNVLKIVPLKNLNIDLYGVGGTGKAYENQGFEYTKEGSNHYNYILNNQKGLDQCQNILNGKKYKYYLQM